MILIYFQDLSTTAPVPVIQSISTQAPDVQTPAAQTPAVQTPAVQTPAVTTTTTQKPQVFQVLARDREQVPVSTTTTKMSVVLNTPVVSTPANIQTKARARESVGQFEQLQDGPSVQALGSTSDIQSTLQNISHPPQVHFRKQRFFTRPLFVHLLNYDCNNSSKKRPEIEGHLLLLKNMQYPASFYSGLITK